MQALTIISLAVGLAMDAFAVAITVGFILNNISVRQYFRLSFHFGLFQALMPLIGWLAGSFVVEYIKDWDHWIAFGLLSYIGGKMIYESFHGVEKREEGDPTKGLKMVSLSVATSIDALAIGLSLAILGVEIIYPALIIGVITCALTLVGMKLGQKLGLLFGHWVEKIGGVVLFAIGLKILIEHLAG